MESGPSMEGEEAKDAGNMPEVSNPLSKGEFERDKPVCTKHRSDAQENTSNNTETLDSEMQPHVPQSRVESDNKDGDLEDPTDRSLVRIPTCTYTSIHQDSHVMKSLNIAFQTKNTEGRISEEY